METLEVQICIHMLFNIVADANGEWSYIFLFNFTKVLYIEFLPADFPVWNFELLDVRLIEQIIVHIIFASLPLMVVCIS